jgi:hypothetical protein
VYMRRSLFLLFCFIAASSYASFQRCDLLLLPVMEIDLQTARPTQGGIGLRQVDKKQKKIERFKSHLEREAYIGERPIPIVKAPGGDIYLLDRHHLALALLKSGTTKTRGYVVRDWSNVQSDEEFVSLMTEQNWFHCFDGDGATVPGPSWLPKTLLELPDDPFRSLASAVRKKGGFAKVEGDPFFTEFRWANFFRERMVIGEWSDSVAHAIKLARSPAAMGLPGYISTLK